MSGENKRAASRAGAEACPDELARELEGGEALWELLGAAAPATQLEGEALEAALARTRAALDDEGAREGALTAREAEDGCPAELTAGLRADEALIDGEMLWRVLGEGALEAPSAEALQRTRAALRAELDGVAAASADGVDDAPATPATPATAPATPATPATAPATPAAPAPALGETAKLPAEPARVRWWQVLLPAAAVALGFVVLRALFKSLPFAADMPLAVAFAAGAALLGALSLPFPRLALGGAAALSGLAVALLSRGGGALGPVAKCGVLELVAAALPLLVGATMLWRRGERSTPLVLGAATAAGALAGQAALMLACPGRSLAHLVASHLGAVLLAAGVGFVVGLLPLFKRARAAG